MANPIVLEKLCQGAKVWNAWRSTHPDAVPDLTDANLTLSQRQFGSSSGGPINLRGANLAGATLRYATLSGADLEDAVLVGADLVHARLDGANLTGADMTDAICDNADMAEAKFDDAVLTGASFANVRNLTEEQIAFAYGDASTLLPAAVMAPNSWFAAAEDAIYPEFPDYPVPEQMADVDLYDVLGVTRTAKPEIIRAAFRNLVKKLHPDVNPDDDHAQELFNKVSTAYRILGDPEKRVRYDKGEIGGDGEINPEFEAKRQFRRYAFRFYTAAAMSLLLAGGVLGVVWHAVLTDDGTGRGRVEIAVATPPKSSERLDGDQTAGSDLKVDFRRRPAPGSPELNQDAAEAPSAIPPQAPSPETAKAELEAAQSAPTPAEAPESTAKAEPAKVDGAGQTSGEPVSLPAQPAGNVVPGSASGADTAQSNGEHAAAANSGAAPEQRVAAAEPQATEMERNGFGASEPAAGAPDIKNAAEHSPPPSVSPPPGTDASPAEAQSAPPHDAKVTTTPLFEEHKGEQPRPAQADAARANASSAQASAPAARSFAGVPYANRAQPPRDEAFMRGAEGRKATRDAISALFRQRAVKQTMAGDQQQATASVDPLASRDEVDAQEEVWDLYTHSIPDAGAATASAWPGFAEDKKPRRHHLRPAARDIAAKVPGREEHPAAASNRKQAVSDILAGGL